MHEVHFKCIKPATHLQRHLSTGAKLLLRGSWEGKQTATLSDGLRQETLNVLPRGQEPLGT